MYCDVASTPFRSVVSITNFVLGLWEVIDILLKGKDLTGSFSFEAISLSHSRPSLRNKGGMFNTSILPLSASF